MKTYTLENIGEKSKKKKTLKKIHEDFRGKCSITVLYINILSFNVVTIRTRRHNYVIQ